MNILLCAGYTEKDCSFYDFKAGFEQLGHKIFTCGPQIGNFEFDDFLIDINQLSKNKANPLLSERDIKVYDKKHPERYSYDEVMRQIKEKKLKIDLILQRDAHFFFYGEPPAEIPTAYYLIDIHRAGNLFVQMAREGKFKYIFSAYKHFERILVVAGLNPTWIPRAVNDASIREYPEIEQECDISFCGETGISPEILDFKFYDEKLKKHYHEGPFSDVPFERRYRCWEDRTMEYVERAELLIRLSKDFKTRIYEVDVNKETYAKMICRGKIGFNYNLCKDLTVRNYQVMACKRLLITNELNELGELGLYENVHLRTYRSYYNVNSPNFDLDYKEIKYLVTYYLEHNEEREKIASQGQELVLAKHTEKDRARQILETIFGK